MKDERSEVRGRSLGGPLLEARRNRAPGPCDSFADPMKSYAMLCNFHAFLCTFYAIPMQFLYRLLLKHTPFSAGMRRIDLQKNRAQRTRAKTKGKDRKMDDRKMPASRRTCPHPCPSPERRGGTMIAASRGSLLVGLRPRTFPTDCRMPEKTKCQQGVFLGPFWVHPGCVLGRSWVHPVFVLSCKTPRNQAKNANSETEEKIRCKATTYAPATVTSKCLTQRR
jgi:hypothetical protein